MIGKYARLVVLAHSVFALPFALWGFAVGVREALPSDWPRRLAWVIVAVVSARTAAMAFNRWADRQLDARNPRTAMREIPRGEVRPREALALTGFAAGVFVLAAWQLAPICGWLAPVALLVLLGYSYTKRFTALSHYVLGLALGLAPVGAYLAVTERFSLPVVGIGLAVLLWVGGFDTLYALQDEAFDRAEGLYSLPARVGEAAARRMAFLSHLAAIALLAAVGAMLYSERGRWLYAVGWLAFALFVLRQHGVSRDKSRIDRAFFTHNGLASVVFGAFAIAALWVK
ncbi:MAG: 4-hydroxybenzoate octaprenyltransferase [Bacteroidia bacterium]|nr:MAG: 4-hydroxybenzoate octaprenyltransferase [Bacteroidia bacterium]